LQNEKYGLGLDVLKVAQVGEVR